MTTPPRASRLLLVFVKEPLPGKVKTRLAKETSEAEAALIYQALVAVLCNQIKGLKDCDVWFCYTPKEADQSVAIWLLPLLGTLQRAPLRTDYLVQNHGEQSRVEFHPQGRGDLGERLDRAFQAGFAQGYQKVAAIGSDCPFVNNRWIETSFLACREDTVAIGPARDGGYYLIALPEMVEEVFKEIPWSTSQTLEASLSQLIKAGKKATLLPELSDIDHLRDWEEAAASPLGPALQKALDALRANSP